MNIVLVEDNKDFGRGFVDVFSSSGHSAIWFQHNAVEHISHLSSAIIVIDLGQLGRDEMRNLARLRRISSVPLLALVPGDDRAELEEVMWHADEYLAKPIDPQRLRLHVERVVRQVAVRTKQVVKTMDVEIHFGTRTVWVGGYAISLTAKEYQVLAVLAYQAGSAVSRGDIEDAVWGADFPNSSRSLDVHMTTLRAKINRPNLIQTVRGFGYRFGDPLRGPETDPPKNVQNGRRNAPAGQDHPDTSTA